MSIAVHRVAFLLALVAGGFSSGCGGRTEKAGLIDTTDTEIRGTPHVIAIQSTPQIVRTFPHDKSSFTQGLFYSDGRLFESAGGYGESDLRAVDTSTGMAVTKMPVDERFFAEGCALFEGMVYQITWKEQTCFVYSYPGLTRIDTLSYTGEGWGIASCESELVMSNGSDTLYFKNKRLKTLRKLPVTLSGKSLSRLNELEYAQGKLYANVWFSDYIFEIDPKSGRVSRVIDCKELVSREAPSSDQAVLNGIAYDAANGVFYLTGKNWKKTFVVKIPS